MTKSLKTSYSIHHQVESFFTGSSIQFDTSGQHFYCAHGSTINKVSIVDGQVKAQIETKNQDDSVLRFTLSPDGNLIIIAYQSGLIVKFNLAEDILEREFKSIHSAPISYLKINLSGTLLATGSSDGTIKLWNLKNHYCSHNLRGVNGVVSCIEFKESSGRVLLFCSAGDDNIHVFDIDANKRIAKLTTHCSTITDMKFSHDGDKLISVGRDKIAVVWDTSDWEDKIRGTTIRTIPLYESVESIVMIDRELLQSLLDSSVAEDSIFFATIGEQGTIKFWDSRSGSILFTQNEPPLSVDRSPGIYCTQLVSRPSHNQLCAVSSEKDIFVYDLPRLNVIQQLQGHIDEILSACWFANDRYLAIACNSNDLKVMEVSTSKTQHFKGHTDIVLAVKAVPSDPMRVISSSKDCTILVWLFEPETMIPRIVCKATGHTHAIHALAISNETQIFFSGGEDTTLKRWPLVDIESDSNNRPTKPLVATQTVKAHEGRIDDIAISPNDQLVATGSRDKTAKIFTVDGLMIVATLRGHRRGVHSVRFSPVDQVVVTAADSNLRMWNLKDFNCVKTFQGHDCSVLNFSFLASGLQMVSVGSDGNMKLWDCKTNECMKTLDAHSGNTWTLSLTEDDSLLVTGGQDEKLVIWRDTTEEEREERLLSMQTSVTQEQDFLNYINKKKWRKALKMAIAMENQNKTLSVLREILLEPEGIRQLEDVLMKSSPERLNFIVDCCVGWGATAKNSAVAQQVFNIIVRQLDRGQLLSMPSLRASMEQLRLLTEKSLNRYERLTQQAHFVDFFLNSLRIQ